MNSNVVIEIGEEEIDFDDNIYFDISSYFQRTLLIFCYNCNQWYCSSCLSSHNGSEDHLTLSIRISRFNANSEIENLWKSFSSKMCLNHLSNLQKIPTKQYLDKAKLITNFFKTKQFIKKQIPIIFNKILNRQRKKKEFAGYIKTFKKELFKAKYLKQKVLNDILNIFELIINTYNKKK